MSKWHYACGSFHHLHAVLLLVPPAAVPQSFGEELLAALLCQHAPPGAAAVALSPTRAPQQQPTSSSTSLEQQLAAGRAAMALSFLLQHNPMGQLQLLSLQVPAGEGSPPGSIEPLMSRMVKLLQGCTRRSDSKALPLCHCLLRLLVAWCAGCSAAVSALLAYASQLALLADLVGKRVASGDVHTAGVSG